MVKTNIIKTKKNRKKMLIFLIFFYKTRGLFWDTSIKKIFLAKNFFSQK